MLSLHPQNLISMRAALQGRALMQGLAALVHKATAQSSTMLQPQWPSVVSQGSLAAPLCAAAGLHQLVPAHPAQQHWLHNNSTSSSSSTNSSRQFSSRALPPFITQQQQQQHQHVGLPCQQLSVSLSLLPQQQQQQHHQLLQPQFGVIFRHFVLMPRRVKYRKAHKSQGFNETICPNTRQLAFGLYGIRATEHCRVPARTIEAARRTLRRTIKKTAMLWIRVTPNVPVTSKPAEVRMGKGKGTLDYWAAPIRPGQIIFEMDRCTKTEALAALKSIEAKLPMKVGFVEWN